MAEKGELFILHLSDLHAGHPDCWWASTPSAGGPIGYANTFAQDLAAHLKDTYRRPFDLLVLSGDLVEKGGAQTGEYTAVRGFLHGLRDAMGDRFPPLACIVPGNHDVNWEPLTTARNPNDAQNYELKFKEFRTFLRMALDPNTGVATGGVEGPDLSFASSHPYTVIDSEFCSAQQDQELLERFQTKPFLMVGLNSAECEGARFQDHFGFVNPIYIKEVERRYLRGQSPWQLRLAVIHHQPIVTPDDPKIGVPEITQLCDREENAPPTCAELSRLANYLHGSANVLRTLEGIGVQLVLSGHRHFSDPQHYVFQQRDTSPFSHGGITVLRVGCFGLRQTARGAEGKPSFQVVRIQQGNFRFMVSAYRHVIDLEGNSPQSMRIVDIKIDGPRGRSSRPTVEFACYSARPTRVLDGLVNLLSQRTGAEEDEIERAGKREEGGLESYLFCGARIESSMRDMEARYEERRMYDLSSGEDDSSLLRDIEAVMWSQLRRDVLKNANLYADLPHWSLASVSQDAAYTRVICNFALSQYLQYLLLNIGLKKCVLGNEGDRVSFRQKHLLSRAREYTSRDVETVDRFLLEHPYLGLRTTFQVVFYVPRQDGTGRTFLKLRSRQMGHFRGMVQFPVGGGFKWLQGEEDVERRLGEAVEEEIRLETGVENWDMRHPCMALTVNTETFCPAFTFLLEIPEEKFRRYFALKHPLSSIEFKRCLDGQEIRRTLRVEKWQPVRGRDGLPRDWWEGQFLMPVEVQRGENNTTESVFTEILGRIKDFFVQNQIGAWLDPYPGSCIELYLGNAGSRRSLVLFQEQGRTPC